jgi:hypothetical protein
MKAEPFDSTPDFQRFKQIMRGVLSVSKQRLDELVRAAKENSPRNGDPHAPGQKRIEHRPTTRKKSKPSQDNPHG